MGFFSPHTLTFICLAMLCVDISRRHHYKANKGLLVWVEHASLVNSTERRDQFCFVGVTQELLSVDFFLRISLLKRNMISFQERG